MRRSYFYCAAFTKHSQSLKEEEKDFTAFKIGDICTLSWNQVKPLAEFVFGCSKFNALIYPNVCFRLRFVFQIILQIIPEISINLLNMILFKSNMLFINFSFNKERI